MTEAPIASEPKLALFFGSFELLPNAGGLRDNGRPVRLGSRALELLAALAERKGEVVASDELIARVWPNTTVDEQNLRVQIAGLRKALADGHGDERFIATVSGRGYRFVAPLSSARDVPGSVVNADTGNLPAALSRLFGRANTISGLRDRLTRERLVTIVGPGGVGKTSVAIVAAQEVPVDNTWFVDLAPVSDPALVPTAILGAIGLAALPTELVGVVARHLRNRKTLIVFDNCEHLVDVCASTAEALLAAAPGLRILATSREPLRAAGEWIWRLPPLDVPGSRMSPAAAAGYPAIQLFMHRAASSAVGLELTETNLGQVIDICRRLDGIPLALELAAAAVGMLGVRGVAQRLTEQLALPSRGRRTVLARQATLSTMLNWSYGLLAPAEQRALRRLAIFRGGFSLDSAVAVAGRAPADSEAALLEVLASLAEKSLVTVELGGDEARYRLLQMTRAFALGQMSVREVAATRARHARELRRLATASETAWGTVDDITARRLCADLIDDLGEAAEWALSPLGDVSTAVDLIVDSAPLRRRLSLVTEYRDRVERALAQVRRLSPPNPTAEMRLLGAYGISRAFQVSRREWLMEAADRLERLARMLNDDDHLLMALWEKHSVSHMLGEHQLSEACTASFAALARTRPGLSDRILSHLMKSQCAVRAGDLAAAGAEIDAGLQASSLLDGDLLLARLGFDPVTYLRLMRPRVLWATGFADQAMAAAHDCVAECRRRGHAHTITLAIADAVAFAGLLNGDIETASAAIEEHRVRCETYGEVGLTAKSQVVVQVALRVAETGVGDRAAADLIAPDSDNPAQRSMDALFGRIAEAVGKGGAPADGIAAVDAMLATSNRHPTDWCRSELLRARAVLLRMMGTPDDDVERLLLDAQALARAQGALAWELRIVADLAELRFDQGRSADARALLSDMLGRMPEGHDTADFRRAATLKDRLTGPRAL
jgi:predicted ATPase/DNA-binding winged helix-turn-helix (wHTH) protein